VFEHGACRGSGEDGRAEKARKPELERLRSELSHLLPRMAKHEIEELTTQIRQVYFKRFHKRKTPKYGSLNKGFTSQELQAFFRVIDDERLKLLFAYQSQLGLRIGEVCGLHLGSINFETRELTLKTEKARVTDSMIIPAPLFTDTLTFIRKYEKQIEKAGGYIFFKCAHSSREALFMGPNYVRAAFRRYVVKAGLDFTYDISDESIGGREVRSLHRLTTHSLRHYAITTFAKTTNGNVVLTSRFARHASPETTMTYINTSKEELYDGIEGAASGISQVMGLKARIAKRDKA
jgi:integrase